MAGFADVLRNAPQLSRLSAAKQEGETGPYDPKCLKPVAFWKQCKQLRSKYRQKRIKKLMEFVLGSCVGHFLDLACFVPNDGRFLSKSMVTGPSNCVKAVFSLET